MNCQHFSYTFINKLFVSVGKCCRFRDFCLTSTLALGCFPVVAQSFSQNDAKVSALLSQMTLDEKIGQMVQVDSGALTDKGDVAKYFIGSVLSGGSSDPAAGNSPQAWLDEVNGFKAEALSTRLKIPLIYGIDAIHGHNNIDGAVIFPHHVGMGATHDPALVTRAEQVTAAEVAGTGIRWAFAPCIAVPQDERWGRTYEGYSDDPAPRRRTWRRRRERFSRRCALQ
jgi:beta-glucosidase